jgi:protocatechuate 3,4-dioxygenase beta subunit
MVRPFFLSSLPLDPPSFLTPPAASTAVPLGESIASEGKGEYMYVEGRVLTTSGEPVPGAVIETWETDDKGE